MDFNNDALNLIATIATVITAIAAVAAAIYWSKELRELRKDAQASLEDDLSREYRATSRAFRWRRSMSMAHFSKRRWVPSIAL